ncbi:hypothetical protein CKO28_06095 [Rhodovibrio sodomensis]|uniref:HD Cas3-type domain-containing protein n=2 Tax=Rhodovibrio sodomensis TaxID=1088 RepID=A0ABS1DAX3_9PROT|nr:hypothetical protein [Rhodovibrio sodomensis]
MREPAFIIGSRARFNRSGQYAVQTQSLGAQPRVETAGFEQLRCIVSLAALLHDVGKASAAFQWKLRGKRPLADPVRHELISTLFFQALMGQAGGLEHLLADLSAGVSKGQLQKAYAEAAREADRLVDDSSLTRIAWRVEDPVASSITLLIATHHRLLEAEISRSEVRFTAAQHVRTASRSEFGTHGCEHAPYGSLFDSEKLRSALQREARQLASALQHDWALDSLTVYAYGRLALMLGDQHASARKVAEAEDHELAANSLEIDGQVKLGERLGNHLISVSREANGFVRMLRRAQDAFPAVPADGVPDALTAPSARGRFGWQGHAVTRLLECDAKAGGFFGIVLVRTGGGKTRGCPAALLAAAPRCRFFLGLGLRSLTLQSGAEYVRDVGFAPDDVATIVGDFASRRLHEIGQDQPEEHGTSAEPQVFDDIVVGAQDSLSMAGPESDEPSAAELAALGGRPLDDPQRQLPHQLERALADTGQTGNDKLLRTPVVAATVDQVMACADARRGGHLYRTLRVATSDLILDEIDCYEPEDVAAILRLVALAGAFGRRVIIASATIPPAVAEALHEAYTQGYSAYARMHAVPDKVTTAWIYDNPDLSEFRVVDRSTFAAMHRTIADRITGGLAAEPSRRRMEVIEPDERSEEAAYGAMLDSARQMHERHHFELDGICVSLGVVRFSNVRSARAFTRYVTRTGVSDSVIGIACYHARLVGVIRFETERLLNELLVRKGSDPDGKIRQHPRMRRLVDAARASGKQHVMAIVATTPVEETGRDHDFDYAVAEPSSIRSLIQLAGRVLRHRDVTPAKPNFAVLSAPMAYWRGDTAPFWVYPGVETPVRASRIQAPVLDAVKLPDLVDIAAFERGIDATLCLAEPDEPINELSCKEHKLLRDFLLNPSSGGIRFVTDPSAPFATWLPINRRFRRSEASTTYYMLPDNTRSTWWAVDDTGCHPVDGSFAADVEPWRGAPERDVFPLIDICIQSSIARLRGLFRNCRDERFSQALLSFDLPGQRHTRIEHDWLLGADRTR